jgi:hypothetical protein
MDRAIQREFMVDTCPCASRPKSKQFAKSYWNEVVLRAAKMLIPTHWDNSMLPLDQPLHNSRPPGDDDVRSMGWPTTWAATDRVTTRFPREFELIEPSGRPGT